MQNGAQPTRNADGRYGPTARGDYYLPIRCHGRTAKKSVHKSRWAVREGRQYLLFRPASEGWWHCDGSNGLFSISPGGQLILGRDGERLAFFPHPRNASDPWHGFPVSSSDKRPGISVIDMWIDAGVITEHVRRKLEGGRL